MVSQPDHHSSLALRAPSSVVSRPSVSRSKRYGRSHTGGSSYVPQNEFPVFNNSGDVEILIRAGSVENRYLLHRHTLTCCSGFFEASTSVEWSKAKALPSGKELARIREESPSSATAGADSTALGSPSGTGPRKRWRYELDPGTGDGDIPMLIQKEEFPTEAPTKQQQQSSRRPSIFGDGAGSHQYSSSRTPSGGTQSRSKASHAQTSSMPSNHSFFRSVANLSLSANTPPTPANLTQADQDVLRDYDNLFRIFYNYSPVLDGINVADAYVQCKSLLTLADQYDALAVVGPRVDHHLLQFQSRLWKQIAKYPISYLRLGYLARSKIIFQEALIHVVGQWPAGERSLRAALPDVVLDIIEDKVDELEETVSRVEGRLFRLNLTTSRGDRVAPGVNYLDWLVMSLFRQWVADNTTPQPPVDHRNGNSRGDSSHGHSRSSHQPPPPPPQQQLPPITSVGRAYRTLGSGNPSSFLGHDECKRFLKLTPELYSRDNLRRFEKRMDELKAMARDIVRPLMGSGLELDMNGSSRAADGITYLTCTSVGNRDLPWPVDD